MNEKEVEEKNNENSQVNGMNNFISKIFGGKGQQEADSLEKESMKSQEKSDLPTLSISGGGEQPDIPPVVVPMKTGRKNLKKTKGSGTTIITIEKPVQSSSNM